MSKVSLRWIACSLVCFLLMIMSSTYTSTECLMRSTKILFASLWYMVLAFFRSKGITLFSSWQVWSLDLYWSGVWGHSVQYRAWEHANTSLFCIRKKAKSFCSSGGKDVSTQTVLCVSKSNRIKRCVCLAGSNVGRCPCERSSSSSCTIEDGTPYMGCNLDSSTVALGRLIGDAWVTSSSLANHYVSGTLCWATPWVVKDKS